MLLLKMLERFCTLLKHYNIEQYYCIQEWTLTNHEWLVQVSQQDLPRLYQRCVPTEQETELHGEIGEGEKLVHYPSGILYSKVSTTIPCVWE